MKRYLALFGPWHAIIQIGGQGDFGALTFWSVSSLQQSLAFAALHRCFVKAIGSAPQLPLQRGRTSVRESKAQAGQRWQDGAPLAGRSQPRLKLSRSPEKGFRCSMMFNILLFAFSLKLKVSVGCFLAQQLKASESQPKYIPGTLGCKVPNIGIQVSSEGF